MKMKNSHIRAVVRKELAQARYGSLQELAKHVKHVAELTGGKSGFWGIKFTRLVPVVDEMLKQEGEQ